MEHPMLKDSAACCIAGGGPAGIMLGFLLARAGVDMLVLEKHKDFFRDFRGDTIHPSTLELMHELGLLEDLLCQPHQKLHEIALHFGEKIFHAADFSHLPTHCQYIVFMPQWDFLNFLCSRAKQYPNFRIRMETEATDLLWEDGRILGVKAQTAAGMLEIQAGLVVGADGRHSTVRSCAQLEVIEEGAPIDVLWFHISKKAGDPEQAFGFVKAGQFMVLIDRTDYWQCAYVIRKGAFEVKKRNGLDAFRAEIVRCVPFFGDRMQEVTQWEDVKLLSVQVDHLRRWHREGLLCIGDAAHAMSPLGGVGINLAIQDAVAAAKILAPKLLAGTLAPADLARVQQRREWPARITQQLQIFLHKHFLERIFNASGLIPVPLVFRLTERFPLLRQLSARILGMGFRPEHMP
jgi:2-polyprenyl-6-methoxyphenol hydroxylase-like FAD-dependent oxidoreductase